MILTFWGLCFGAATRCVAAPSFTPGQTRSPPACTTLDASRGDDHRLMTRSFDILIKGYDGISINTK